MLGLGNRTACLENMQAQLLRFVGLLQDLDVRSRVTTLIVL